MMLFPAHVRSMKTTMLSQRRVVDEHASLRVIVSRGGDDDDDKEQPPVVAACRAASQGNVATVDRMCTHTAFCAAELFAIVSVALDARATSVVIHMMRLPRLRGQFTRTQLTALLFIAVRVNALEVARAFIQRGANARRIVRDAQVSPQMRLVLEREQQKEAPRIEEVTDPQTTIDIAAGRRVDIVETLKGLGAARDAARLASIDKITGIVKEQTEDEGHPILVIASGSQPIGQRTFFLLTSYSSPNPPFEKDGQAATLMAYRLDDLQQKIEQEQFRYTTFTIEKTSASQIRVSAANASSGTTFDITNRVTAATNGYVIQ